MLCSHGTLHSLTSDHLENLNSNVWVKHDSSFSNYYFSKYVCKGLVQCYKLKYSNSFTLSNLWEMHILIACQDYMCSSNGDRHQAEMMGGSHVCVECGG